VVRGPIPEAEYAEIYRRVPRLTVEVVISSARGVLLSRRDDGPCAGLWNIPGGTVRFGEPLVEAVGRVAGAEVRAEVEIVRLLGYLEYPSHLERGIDWPVALAFACRLSPSCADPSALERDDVNWFTRLPASMHDEQRRFLRDRGLAA
jgi:ADP-ribose pyrophosphatase YjhB (NUDIX family)